MAVLAVVVYHVWPDVLPGGFVGVDVFFVISGFLITSMLAEDLRSNGRISIIRFYDRRIRRILPAATLVLLVLSAAIPLLPVVRWEDSATGIAAAALYFENWYLAFRAVDYLAEGAAPTPAQHFWSLSIEEQFYLAWPLIMVAIAALVVRRGTNPERALIWPLSAVVALSLAASIIVTATNPAFAYFATHTRIWELGLGALLALASIRAFPAPLAEGVRGVGLAAIFLSLFLITPDTPFPGYIAAIPTFGSALVIAAGPRALRWGPYSLISNRLAVYIGGISYSMYLWHWPLIVFAAVYLAGQPDIATGVGLIAATLVLSDLTKRLVEDPFRRRAVNPARVIGFGAAAVAVCVALPMWATLWMSESQPTAMATAKRYPGAAVYFGKVAPEGVTPIPPLVDLAEARSKHNCTVAIKDIEPRPCEIGRSDGRFKVVIVGDSHAGVWSIAFERYARRFGWSVVLHTKSGCPLVKLPTTRPNAPYYEACLIWGQKVLELLRQSPPDVLIFAQADAEWLYKEGGGVERPEKMAAAVADVWRDLHAMGIEVVAIRDVPALTFHAGECLATREQCTVARSEAFRFPNIMAMAAEINRGVPVVDMSDAICSETECPVVVGNVIAWRDGNHLTSTYIGTLAPFLLERLKAASPRLAAAARPARNSRGEESVSAEVN